MTKVLPMVFILLVSLAPVILRIPIPAVRAEDTGPYATLFPSKGTVLTNITIEVRNLTYNVHYDLYLSWDDVEQIQALDNPSYWPMGSFQPTWLPYYNIEMNAPNEHPLSDLGNHTLLIQVWDFQYTELAFNSTLTFEIVEQLPCNEWLVLNATYYSLLANYTALNAAYVNLQIQYGTLTNNYYSLQTHYDDLLGQYSGLLTSYNSLSSDYAALSGNFNDLTGYFNSLNSSYYDLLESYTKMTGDFNILNSTYFNLNANYQNLQASYNGLNGSYNSLQSIHDALNSNYAQLQSNYTSLVSSYNDLQTDNNDLSTDLTTYRNLSYIMIITTIALLITTIYFARRKPKQE